MREPVREMLRRLGRKLQAPPPHDARSERRPRCRRESLHVLGNAPPPLFRVGRPQLAVDLLAVAVVVVSTVVVAAVLRRLPTSTVALAADADADAAAATVAAAFVVAATAVTAAVAVAAVVVLLAVAVVVVVVVVVAVAVFAAVLRLPETCHPQALRFSLLVGLGEMVVACGRPACREPTDELVLLQRGISAEPEALAESLQISHL